MGLLLRMGLNRVFILFDRLRLIRSLDSTEAVAIIGLALAVEVQLHVRLQRGWDDGVNDSARICRTCRWHDDVEIGRVGICDLVDLRLRGRLSFSGVIPHIPSRYNFPS